MLEKIAKWKIASNNVWHINILVERTGIRGGVHCGFHYCRKLELRCFCFCFLLEIKLWMKSTNKILKKVAAFCFCQFGVTFIDSYVIFSNLVFRIIFFKLKYLYYIFLTSNTFKLKFYVILNRSYLKFYFSCTFFCL